MDYIFIGVVAFFVSIGSSIAGGGGGLIMTPLAIIIGFPPQTAIASGKGGGLGINLGALTKFTRHKNIINWYWAKILSVLALIASLIGTQIVFRFDAEALSNFVGIATIIVVATMFFSRNIGLKQTKTSSLMKALGMIMYFVILTFQAGIGSGIGTLLMFVLMGMFGLDALSANATKRLASLVLVISSFIIFAFSGYMDWLLVTVLLSANFCGGYIGAHLAVKHGNILVKHALLLVSLIMGITVLIT